MIKVVTTISATLFVFLSFSCFFNLFVSFLEKRFKLWPEDNMPSTCLLVNKHYDSIYDILDCFQFFTKK